MADDKQKAEKNKYADQIRQLIPVNELSQDVQNQFINEAKLLQIKKKGKVFKQGDRDNSSFYLLDGKIELQANKQIHNTISSGTDQARYAMAQLQPRQFTGVATEPSVILQISRDALDRYMLLNQEKSGDEWGDSSGMAIEVEEGGLDDDEDVDWMTRLLQSDIFARMPTANIHQLFALLEPLEYSTGDVVVQQGDSGEDFYIIQEGRCQVSRKPSAGGKDIKLAELRTGDSFGEEALLAETTRNATVSMITDGVLMRLNKEHFNELVRDPTLHSIPFEEADIQVKAGKAKWLDIRYQNEHERSAIAGSLHIPQNMLRVKMEDELDQDTYYILYCDTGGRSSAAAFLLAGAGYNVSYLKGGLVNSPGAADPGDVTDIPKPKPEPKPEPKSEPQEPAAKAEAKKPAKPEAPPDDKDMDPEIKSSYLETEINRTNMELERTSNKEEKDAALKKAQDEERKKLEQERARLEAEKKKSDEAAQKLRRQEEEKLKQLESDAKKRIEEEKKRLEEIYSRNAEEMEKLEKMKKEAEEQARKEKERIEQQASAAKNDRGEAERLRKELEASRRKMVEEEKKRKQQQEEMERKIQTQARQKLEAERKKMAEEYARNNQELEQAKRERAAAEAARVAAKKEAEKMISEYKSQHEKNRAEEEERLKHERAKLEEDQRKIQETLKEIQAAREEAESLKKTAQQEVAALREKQKKAADKAKSDNVLKEEIKQAEARLHKAKINVAQTQQQSVKIQEQRRVNAANLETNKEEEEALRKQLEADLNDFKQELEEEEEQRAGMRTQIEHMRRIRERAEAAKNEAQSANSDLLSDIEDQLGGKK